VPEMEPSFLNNNGNDKFEGKLHRKSSKSMNTEHLSRGRFLVFATIATLTFVVWAIATINLLFTSPIARFALDDVQLSQVLEERQARTAKCIDELMFRRANLDVRSRYTHIPECTPVQWLAHPDHRWQDPKFLVVVMGTPEAVPQLDEWLGYEWLHVIIVTDPSNSFQLSARHEKLARYVVELEANSPFLNSLQGQRRRWTAVARALQPLRMRNYKYTWFPDSNVRMDVQSVQRMLHLAVFYDVRAGHPAVGKSLGSRISASADAKAASSENKMIWSGNAVEWVDGIGAVAPFFRSDAVGGVLTLLSNSLMWTTTCGPEIVLSEYLALAGARTAMIPMVSYDYHVMENQEKMSACMRVHGKVRSVATMEAYRQQIAGSCSWCLSKSSKSEVSAETIEQLPMDPSLPPRWRSPRFLREARFRVLIIVVADDNARFDQWSGYEQFDVALVYTGSSAAVFRRFSKDADFAYRLRGQKFSIARRLLMELEGWAEAYEYVWFPDGDIDMGPIDVQQLVNVASRLDVPLAHPAMVESSNNLGVHKLDTKYFHEYAHEQRRGMTVHFVNRVLMAAPLVRVDAVEYLLPTFVGDGTFLDMLWPQLLRFPLIAVVDAAPYRQTPQLEIPHSTEIPAQLQLYGCVQNYALKTGDKITRFQFQMLVRRNEDKDWCVIEPYKHWFDALRKPNEDGIVEEHTLAWEDKVLQELRVDPTLQPLWWSETRLEKVRGKNLIIIVAGDTSLHRAWAKNPSYDLCVVYFGEHEQIFNMYKRESTYAFNVKGMKWQLVRYALNHLDWKQYEYIWLPDDDITMDPEFVVKMFDLAVLYDVRLGQPAVYEFGAHYQDHVVRGNWSIHWVNFIEIMVPFLRVDALEFVFPLWDIDYVESGYGLDSLWPQFLRRKLYGIIDATPCNHTGGKILGGRPASFYSRLKMDPLTELAKTMLPYDCFELWNVTEILGHVTVEEHNAAFPELQLVTVPNDIDGADANYVHSNNGRSGNGLIPVRKNGQRMVKLPSLKRFGNGAVRFSGSNNKAYLLPSNKAARP